MVHLFCTAAGKNVLGLGSLPHTNTSPLLQPLSSLLEGEAYPLRAMGANFVHPEEYITYVFPLHARYHHGQPGEMRVK